MKVVFMGTPDFAVPVLERLIAEHEVVCVYTKEPKIAGRGNNLTKTPVHLLAEKHGIEVRTPKSLKNEAEQQAFCALDADISVVAAYGLILPKVVIEAFKKGCINVHASLLPRWRGAAPIQRSIEYGDEKSGVTIMQVVEALDAGAMYKKGEVEMTCKINTIRYGTTGIFAQIKNNAVTYNPIIAFYEFCYILKVYTTQILTEIEIIEIYILAAIFTIDITICISILCYSIINKIGTYSTS